MSAEVRPIVKGNRVRMGATSVSGSPLGIKAKLKMSIAPQPPRSRGAGGSSWSSSAPKQAAKGKLEVRRANSIRWFSKWRTVSVLVFENVRRFWRLSCAFCLPASQIPSYVPMLIRNFSCSTSDEQGLEGFQEPDETLRFHGRLLVLFGKCTPYKRYEILYLHFSFATLVFWFRSAVILLVHVITDSPEFKTELHCTGLLCLPSKFLVIADFIMRFCSHRYPSLLGFLFALILHLWFTFYCTLFLHCDTKRRFLVKEWKWKSRKLRREYWISFPKILYPGTPLWQKVFVQKRSKFLSTTMNYRDTSDSYARSKFMDSATS